MRGAASLLLVAWVPGCLAGTFTLNDDGTRPNTIRFESPTSTAVLEASCSTDQIPTVQWTTPRRISEYDEGAGFVRAFMMNVPTSCAGRSIATPCASSHPDYPKLFSCTFQGALSSATTPALAAATGGDGVYVECPLPPWASFVAATGFVEGTAKEHNLTLSVQHAGRGAPIEFGGLAAHAAVLTVELDGIPNPSTPPPLPPLPPSPSPPTPSPPPPSPSPPPPSPSPPPPSPPVDLATSGGGGAGGAMFLYPQTSCPPKSEKAWAVEEGKVYSVQGTIFKCQNDYSPPQQRAAFYGGSGSANSVAHAFAGTTCDWFSMCVWTG